MKHKGVTLVAIIIALIFTICVSYLAYSFAFEYKKKSQTNATFFDSFALETKKELESSTSPKSEPFRKKLEMLAGPLENYTSILLTEDGINLYAYPSEEVALASTSSRFIKTYKSTFYAKQKSYTLQASLYLLHPHSIFYKTLLVFLIILALTLIAFLLLIYLYLSANPVQNIDIIPQEEYTTTNNSENAKIQTSEHTNISTMSAQNEKVVQGLFSPVSGLSWENYLLPRLESELIRAASSENDLSLILLKIPTVSLHSSIGKEICKTVLERFQFKDLVFEYEDDSIAFIKEADTKEALDFADALYADMDKLLNATRLKCFIGISSRNMRMLSSERLLEECKKALAHSEEDSTSPVTAFQADIEKYRRFIESTDDIL